MVSQAEFPWGAVALILAIVCIVRRREAIGGWLLYFLSRAVIDGVVTVVALVLGFRNFFPAAWHDPKLHLIYVLSRPPQFLAAICLALVAIEATRHTDLQSFERLRVAARVRAGVGAIVLAVDYWCFPTLTRPDLNAVGSAVITLLYLWHSVRVDRVYAKRDWGATVSQHL